jgi:hypothetical protein
MTVERLPGKDLRYFLVAFDEHGKERTDDPDGLMSQKVLRELQDTPVTDVFFLSHGWKGDIPAAREQYNKWIGSLVSCTEDMAQAKVTRPGFKPLFIGLQWESLPWGDEEFGGSATSFAPTAGTPIDELVENYAQRIAPTGKAKEALRTIFNCALRDMAPDTLPEEVRRACQVLDRESGLTNDGEGGAPGQDREPFDPEMAYQNAQ